MNLCPTCRKLIYRTDPCRGIGVECGRTDGGSTKSTAARKDVLPITRIEPAASRLCPVAPRMGRGLVSTAVIGGANNRVGDEAASRELKASNQAGTQAMPVDAPLTAKGTPRKRKPNGTFDRKEFDRNRAKLRREKEAAERRAKQKGTT